MKATLIITFLALGASAAAIPTPKLEPKAVTANTTPDKPDADSAGGNIPRSAQRGAVGALQDTLGLVGFSPAKVEHYGLLG
ncbi:hypothetical protein ASPVEDRAFT_153564 [Aspergillus versicolor CBS 583.65]|uniref:Uncharacterized protein n=1 Tax=Aspergillus versicolor CBS 583.65 TaxID=1036611 RepID=A0A1L9PUY5_ASPVE|nr:uncharacterized protein ASPVEDRAFT_153564 [Aspergillus versicolor CBS 583.65]OJJ05331.1 hypothetical protein ASPVEDRAFT_153564 [Aspergillus versicolor CBS 583.65]